MELWNSYIKAVNMMGRPTRQDVKNELKELAKDKSLEEISDVIHSMCRYVGLPAKFSWMLAKPTAKKHAVRVQERGCPRSKRNCETAGDNCCCKRKRV